MNDNYRRIVQGFGLYHALASLPLALPILSEYTLGLFGWLHHKLNLAGEWPTFDPTALLFLNLFATLAVFWGIFRIRRPSLEIGRYEGWAMAVFTAIVTWHVWKGASPLWLSIALVDGVGAGLHLIPAGKDSQPSQD